MSSIRRQVSFNKKKMVKIAVVIAIVLVVLLILMQVLKKKVGDEFGNNEEVEVLTAEVTMGSISTTISGSGSLEYEDADEIAIPQTVEINEIYVQAGDTVAEGDILASVNSASVVAAMNEVQEELDALDEQLSKVSEEETEDKITSGVDGRVKKIYVKDEEDVADAMYDHKALMLISVDGYMAVDVSTDALVKGDEVTVKTSGGKKYTGTVDSVWAGKATILITDDGTKYGDEVTVSLGDGLSAEGKLYIHECVKVTGYTGTVSAVHVSANEKVSTGDTLLSLDNISGSANYATILEKREALEEKLQNLIVIYKEGAVYADTPGIITSVTEVEESTVTTTTANTSGMMGMGGNSATTEVSSLEDGEGQDTVIAVSSTEKMLLTVSVDESDILSLNKEQTATISIESLGEDTYTGTVTEIDKSGTSSSGVTTYAATISMERAEGMLAGMSASAVITIEGKDNTLLVPEAAVNKTSSTAYVYTSYDEETGEFGDMVEVTIGLSNGNYVEITEGLSEGDTVYYQESEEESDFPFGNMPDGFGMPGGDGGFSMPGGGGFSMPSGGGMPGGGGMSGGGMPGN